MSLTSIEQLVDFLEHQSQIERCPVSESCKKLHDFISSHEETFSKELEPAQNPYAKQNGNKKRCFCF